MPAVVAATIIDGGQSGSVVTFDSDETLASVLWGLKITNGNADQTTNYSGGGIYISGASPTIKDCIVENNTADLWGGGIYAAGGAPVIDDCDILQNSVGTYGNASGGGIYLKYSSATVINNDILDNTASGTSNIGAGGLAVSSSNSTGIGAYVAHNFIDGNSTVGLGGGIYLVGTDPVTIFDNTITNNSATLGAGIMTWGSLATIENNEIFFNDSGSGGGIYLRQGTTTVVNNEIMNNTAVYSGGGFYADTGTEFTFTDNLVQDNSNGGMGIGVSCVATIERNIISGSTYGGGLYPERGFAIYIFSDKEVTIRNNYIYDCDGGIYVRDSGGRPPLLVTAYNNTIVGNGYGVESELASLDFFNNNIVSNGIGIRVTGTPLTTFGWTNNVYGSTTANYVGAVAHGTDISADPLFTDAGSDNYSLTVSSPCIDAGSVAAGLTTDFELDMRPFDGDGDHISAYDIGADEVIVFDMVNPVLSAPSVAPGTYCAATGLSLSATDDFDQFPAIYYTLDGSDPHVSGIVYSGPILLDSSMTVKAYAVDLAGNESATATYAYVIDTAAPVVDVTPKVSYQTGPITMQVTFSSSDDTDPSPAVYYTLDGSLPTVTTGILYAGGAVSFNDDTTVRYFAQDYCGKDAATQSEDYVINHIPSGSAPDIVGPKQNKLGSSTITVVDADLASDPLESHSFILNTTIPLTEGVATVDVATGVVTYTPYSNNGNSGETVVVDVHDRYGEVGQVSVVVRYN